MLNKKILVVLLASFATLILNGCATEVKRVAVDEVKDLSGNWNDTDSRLVSEEMIRDALSQGWIDRHEKKTKKTPTSFRHSFMFKT